MSFHDPAGYAQTMRNDWGPVGALARAYLALVGGPRPLTARQRAIFEYIAAYIKEHGYAPSFEEIAARFMYASLATVHEHLCNLERKGWIHRGYNESRAISIVSREEQAA